ncbi:MAG: DUF3833 family protein [Pseudomonadota bacterium]
MNPQHLLPIALALVASPAPASAQQSLDPLRFFEGRTENVGTAKLLFHRPYRTRSIGVGWIEKDGSLTLVQRVEDEGKPPRERRWHVRQTGAGHYSGTLSDAAGPVTIEKIGNAYCFRFAMKGNVGVEQWLTPMPGGGSAKSSIKVRKLGLTIGTSEAVIRKLASR